MSSKPKPNSMKVNGDHGLVPKLRFPQFAGQPWRTIRLTQVTAECTERNGGQLASEAVMGVTKADGIVPMRERLIGADISRYKIVRRNWFAYNPMRLNIGSIARWQSDRDVLVSPDYVVFRCLEGCEPEATPDFVDHFRCSRLWEAFVTASGDGSVRTRIYYKDIAEITLGLPTVAEQQRIADCLNSVDELIAAQGRKLHALQAHKRGLLQSMFPREGEIVPRLRLPEYRTAPEWTESTVGTWCKSFSGGTPDTTKKEYYGGTIPFIRSAEIGSDATELFLTDAGLKNSAAKLVKTGDVLVALYGANSGDVAIAKIDGAINQAILCLRPAGSQAFLYHYLTALQDWVTATYLQGGQGNLSGDIVKSIPIRLPSPEEQASIANGLAVADQLLAVQSQLLGFLNAHKVGLLQNLFPPPREVRA
jgi:type I restriction enzyme, S subunit